MSGNGIILDLRIAIRQLRRNATVPLICVGVLAFGLGVNTAVFSALYKVVLKPLPYPNPEQLVAVHNRFPGLGIDRTGVSVADYLDLREHPELFPEAGVYYMLDLTRTGIDRPEKINAVAVTSSLLRTLGVSPLTGRLFNPAEEQYHGAHAVIISETYWRAEFGADRQILARSLQLDGETYPIVGVMPDSFRFPTLPTQMWVPVSNRLDREAPGANTNHYLRMMARLAPGVRFEQISAPIGRLGPSLFAASIFAAPMARDDDGSLRRWIGILFASVSCLLLIVCANVAGLLLVRSTSRQFELSVRMALGAGRLRIARLMLIEVLILAAAGGAGALLLAQALAGLLSTYGPVGAVEIEAPVYWFGLAMTFVSGIACGFYPAWSATRSNAIDSLKQGGAQRTASRGQQRWRQGLIVAQVGIATALLVSGGLLTHSLLRLLQVPLGFDAKNVLTAEITLHGARYQAPGARAEFFRSVLEQAGRIPGVEAASAGRLPFGYAEVGTTFVIAGEPKPRVDPYADLNTVLPNYFTSMRIPLLRGRWFTEQDGMRSENVVIVDKALADRYVAGRDPVGQRIVTPRGTFIIAGMVGSVKTTALDVDPRPQLYFPVAQSNPSSMSIVIRSGLPESDVIDDVERIVHAVDPDQAVYQAELLQTYVDKSFKARRFVALLMAAFAIAGAMLAAVGLYALLSYMATLRRREAGIRMVLGANPTTIAWLVCARGAALVAGGAGLGAIAALGISGLMASQLYGTRLQDPAAWLAALAVIALSGIAACAIPAWRAARLDPVDCLRVE
jgi:putative ABC transport system permease protein